MSPEPPAEPPAPETEKPPSSAAERVVERLLLASRWLLVPLYGALAVLLFLFVVLAWRKVYAMAATVLVSNEVELILDGLRLVDVTLVASLVVMVMLSGYENYIAPLDETRAARHLGWLRRLDAGSVKVRIAGSVVAVSGIDLLHAYMDAENYSDDKLMWRVIIHLALLATAVAFALLDHREAPPRR